MATSTPRQGSLLSGATFNGMKGLLVNRGVLAVVLTVGSAVALFLTARWPLTQEAFAHVDPVLVLIALLASTTSLIAKAARWRLLFPVDIRPGLGLMIAGIAVGQVLNWAMPTRVGEVARVGLVKPGTSARFDPTFGSSVALGVGVLVVEKLIDLALLLVSVVALIGLAGLPDWFRPHGLAVLGVLGALLVAWAVARRATPLPSFRSFAQVGLRFARVPLPALENGLEVLRLGLSSWASWRTLGRVVLWSGVAWGTGIIANVLVIDGLNTPMSPVTVFTAALALLVALYGGAALPSLPGRLGVFQSLCAVALVPLGVSLEHALVVSVVLYGVVYLPPLVLGLLGYVLIGADARS